MLLCLDAKNSVKIISVESQVLLLSQYCWYSSLAPLAPATRPNDRRLQRQRRRQLFDAVRIRYQALSYREKGALVDELVELGRNHRKSVLRLLRQQPADHGGPPARAGADHDSAMAVGRSRRYGPEVVQLLETLWEVSDHLCSKRLAAVLPTLLPALERHGHLEIEPTLMQKLLKVSPATIDRLLAPARAQGEQHRRRRSRIVIGVRRRTTVRTFNGWKGIEPGWFEMDLLGACRA